MENSPTFFDPRTLAKVRGLRLRARQIVEGFVAGLHHNPHHGFSTEFAEHREYSPGDDLRYVDWKVFARTDKFYLKQFEDETNLLCVLAFDVSGSMGYQGPDSPLSKFEYAQCAAASLAWLILQQQDAVGVATFDHQLRAMVRPSSSPAQWQQILQVLENASPDHPTAAGAMLHELAERLTKRSLVIIFSDLFDEAPALLTGLKHLRHRRHDVIVFQVLDPAELDFPFRGLCKFRGLEAGLHAITDAHAIRSAYLQQFELHLRAIRRGCHEQGVDYERLCTDVPLDRALLGYLGRRGTKVN